MSDRRRAEELTARIDELDLEILRAIGRRAGLVSDLIRLRSGNARLSPISDASHLAALERAAEAPLAPSAVRPIFEAIDAACRIFEVAPRVAYAGCAGDFGALVGSLHFGQHAELVAATSPHAALEDVARARADFAVVPYETPEEGPAFEVISAIAAADLRLVGERYQPRALSLVGQTTQAPTPGEGTIVACPPHHLACVRLLEELYPQTAVVDARSVEAALQAALAGPRVAALVPRGTPLPEGLEILHDNLADDGEVRQRWAVVSKLPMPRTGSDATAILFAVRDEPGALHDVLLHFKERGCNLRRIHSRAQPSPTGWDYLFYAEVGGHVTDRPLTTALEGVKRDARTLQIVGSFPLAEPPVVSAPPSR